CVVPFAAHGQPVQRPDLDRELETLALRGPARLGGALVAAEHQLARQVEPPAGGRRLPPGKDLRAHAELPAGGLGQGGEGVVLHDCARVVAVEAGAEVAEELGLPPRAEDRVGLGARGGPGRAAVRLVGHAGQVVAHVEVEDVTAGAGDDPEPRQRHRVDLTYGASAVWKMVEYSARRAK